MRVITGSARGRKLITAEGLNVRPTTDKVKEAIFSAIQFDIEGETVLDLFAGSGQMGIEALSRGAKLAVFVDNSRESHEIIKQNLNNTDLFKSSRVVLMDAKSFIASTHDKFHVIFLDPPYDAGYIAEILPLAVEKAEDNGIVICETPKNLDLPTDVGRFHMVKQYNYGKTKVTTYKLKELE